MRTSLWYSSSSRSARPVPAAFCTVGHAQRKHTATALLPCGNLSGRLLRLAVVSGNLLRVQMRAVTQDIKSKKRRAMQRRPRGLVRIFPETILGSIWSTAARIRKPSHPDRRSAAARPSAKQGVLLTPARGTLSPEETFPTQSNYRQQSASSEMRKVWASKRSQTLLRTVTLLCRSESYGRSTSMPL